MFANSKRSAFPLYKKYCVATLLSLSLTSAHAEHLNSSHYPADLQYANKPVDPLCFFDLDNDKGIVHFNDCGIAKTQYTITEKNKNLTQQGFYGFDWKDNTSNYPSAGSSYYKAWEAGNHHYWLFTDNNGGGSGDFTAINLYSRQNDTTAMLTTVASGDRCNGGISDVKEKNHKLEYGVNLTAYDLLTLAHHDSHLKAYDNISACAACCIAKAYYTVDNQLKPQLLYVDLGHHQESDALPDQGDTQGCFNKVFNAYVSGGKNKLEVSALQQFVEKFNRTCMK